MDIQLFDCNCSYGRSTQPPFRYAKDVEGLLAQMDRCGISKALVHHSGQRFGSPQLWNKRLIDDVAEYPQLLPTYAILPSQTDEDHSPPALMHILRQGSVKALLAFPDEHRFSLDALTFGPLMEEISQRRIPLFVKYSLLGIGELLKDFPDLTVVAVNQGPHSMERYFRPLLDAYPNLYAETSYYIVDGLIEDFCARYGPQRLLFGTAFPDNCAGGSVLQLLHADISNEAKQAIGSGNLTRLLGEVEL